MKRTQSRNCDNREGSCISVINVINGEGGGEGDISKCVGGWEVGGGGGVGTNLLFDKIQSKPHVNEKQESIPEECILPALYGTGEVSLTETPLTKNPWTENPWVETPHRQRLPLWTESQTAVKTLPSRKQIVGGKNWSQGRCCVTCASTKSASDHQYYSREQFYNKNVELQQLLFRSGFGWNVLTDRTET